MGEEHTFVICAYGESPYLEACIKSVKRQRVASKVLLATSTPCSYIENLCRKYGIKCLVNHGEHGIAQDWNYAYAAADTPVVTIAHQDDIYFSRYTERLLQMCRDAKRPLIFFSNYYELRDRRMTRSNFLLRIKRLMLLPLRFKCLQGRIFVRRAVLALGSPICCPSVAFFCSSLPADIFSPHFRSDVDWEAWERISKLPGQFLYCKEPLMAHRIHKDSETTAIISENGRTAEDIEMYKKFWPDWLAVVLGRSYKISQWSNKL